MGGHAWVEDRPGGGARFVVELPTRGRELERLEVAVTSPGRRTSCCEGSSSVPASHRCSSSDSAACGIPTGDDTFSDIPSEEVLFGLEEASTTTSTTTTTMPLAPATTQVETTTTIEMLEQVDVYFLSRGRLQPVPLALTSGFSPGQVVDLLEAGPPSGSGSTRSSSRA